MERYIYEATCHDPYRNLAVEECLLKKAEKAVILYLWQNAHTVVIGKNQNPWKECKTTLLKEEGGHLARRLSGGGAVYHDLGNLNFTFLMPQGEFDLEKQFSVILDALRELGVEATLSGRNDMTAQGRKFSGNAFYKNGKAAYHHGTLLVEADMEKLNRYLSPSRAKLQSKGVDSVRSRVVNLKELNAHITIEALKGALRQSFARIYGPVSGEVELCEAEIQALAERNRSWQWNYGQRLPFAFACEDRFSWGGVQIEMQVENGIVQAAKVYSDAMDWTLAPKLEQTLTGCRFAVDDLCGTLETYAPNVAEDIRKLLRKQDI